MRRTIWAGAILMALSGCGSPGAVGENSAGSIRTTAVGEVVANVAEPTPTPTVEADNATTTETTDDAADAMTNDTASH